MNVLNPFDEPHSIISTFHLITAVWEDEGASTTTHPTPTTPMTDAVTGADIPLVYVNRRPADLPPGVVYVGSDSLLAGRMQMEALAEPGFSWTH